MPYQNINATLSDADVQAIKDAFATIKQKLPFLVNLTPEERRAIVKAGPDSVSFIDNVATAVQNHPTAFPQTFNAPEFQNDVALFKDMTEICIIASSVFSQIDDTRLAVGGEAMKEAMQGYDYIKASAKNTPGLKPVVEQLGERFQKASRSKEAPKA